MTDSTAVHFDLDGTLLTFDDYAAVVEGAFRDRLDRVEPAWCEHYSDRFFEGFEALRPDPYRRAMADVCEAFGLDADPTALVDALVERECAESAVVPGARDLLATLDCPLGVLTNGVGRVQRAKLAHHGLLDALDAVVVSYDVGAHKPDAAAFDAAREALPADRHVLVGDDERADVAGGRAAGFETVHVRGGDPGVTVSGLDDLARVL
ncbi:HAD family hydrolase [Halomarina ordinaria]|uniref:HAD family hydrolase n=1 Tax=Halomarina ordinaria TaxID=3033939 RepID=A0ABD5UF46_9EURY|nr:HAD family hydrolase [Halomarina sp. PSRA2]